MAAKKRTFKKAGKKTASPARRGGKKTARKKTARKAPKKKAGKKSKRAKKPKLSFSLPGGATAYGWGRVPAKLRGSVTQKWARTARAKEVAAASVPAPKLLGAGPGFSAARARAYGSVAAAPHEMRHGMPKDGPWVGPSRPWPKKTKPKSAKLVGAPGGGFGKPKKAKKKMKAASKKTASKKTSKASKKKGLSKAEFLAKMAAGRAAAAASKKTGKKSSKKSSKKASKKKRSSQGGRPAAGNFAANMAAARAAKAAKRSSRKSAGKATHAMAAKKAGKAKSASSSPSRKPTRRKGWPKVGRSKRTFKIPKFKAMNALGVPPNHPISKAKRTMLREAAGRGITAKQVFDMSRATSMKAWICAGRVRTGCGGGSKMLKGSHQIGVFGVGRR